MITGFPHPVHAGFFHQAVSIVRNRGGYGVAANTVVMDRCSACQAQDYLSAKGLVSHPDIVVLQFGSTDAGTPLRRGFGLRWLAAKRKLFEPGKVYTHPAEWKHVLKWRVRGMASDLLMVKSHSTMEDFLAAYENMVRQCLDHGSAVVVLSPLVMGSGRSNRFARHFSEALATKLSGRPGCHYLNAHAVLNREPLRKVLLYDGFHLSALGHALLGEVLGDVLLNAASQIREARL